MIIIPTYNERKNIRPLVGRIRNVLPEVEILFVEDSSPDGTAEEIKELQNEDKNIHLLSRSAKAGFASAYLDGFHYALDKFNPDIIVTMDADLSHPPERLPELIALAKEGKIAIGSRYTAGGSVSNWSLKRKVLSRFGNFYARLMMKLPVRDLTAGFIAIPATTLKKLDLKTVESRGYAFLMELKVRLSELDSEFVEVPITFEERREGESKIGGNIIAEGINYPARIYSLRQIHQNSLAWLLFLISFLVYVLTLPHTIFFGDSPEFLAAASTLGIPHPPGYPAYALIGKLFSLLPLGSLEFRIGLFSALSGSLALVVFYFLFLRIRNNHTIAFVTALTFGFTSLFWSQALMAKVYMPLLLTVLVILLLIAKFWDTKRSGYLLTAIFLFGFGGSLHQIMWLLLPLGLFAMLIYFWGVENRWKYRFETKSILWGILLFIIGLSIYLYLPIREHLPGNFYDFSKIFHTTSPGSFQGFKDYVLRSDYRDLGGKFDVADKQRFLESFFLQAWQQFYWLLIFGGFGLLNLWFISKKFFVLTVGTLTLNVLGILLLRSSSWNFENEYLYSFYYLPAVSMLMIWIGLGLDELFGFVRKNIPNRALVVVSIGLLLLPGFFFRRNLPNENLSNFSFVDDYAKSVLESLPPNAVLLAHYTNGNTDTVLFGLFYEQTVKHVREDVTIMTIDGIHPEADRKIVAYVYGLSDPKRARYFLLKYSLDTIKDRPIYTTYLVDDLSDNWTQASNGLVYRYFPSSASVTPIDHVELDPEKNLKILKSDLLGRDLLAQYYYGQAAYWVGQKDLHQAQSNFIQGINYDFRIMQIDQSAFISYRSKYLKE